jgi:hypothetical protein
MSKKGWGAVVASGLLASAFANGTTLVHRYSFADSVARDSIGRADGRLVGGVTVFDGRAHFTGTAGQRIELLAGGVDGININALPAVTMEAWYRVDDIEKGWQFVFAFGESKEVGLPDLQGRDYLSFTPQSAFGDSRAIIAHGLRSGEATAVSRAAVYPKGTNKDMHVAVVVEEFTITVYLNGVEAAQTDLTNQGIAKVSTQWALLGGSLFGNDPTLSGSIKEFRIYSSALTAAQVAANDAAGPEKVIGQ